MTTVTPVSDALERYHQATVRYEAAVADAAAAAGQRANIILELSQSGMTYREIAAHVGMSHVRVAQLIARTRAARGPERQQAIEAMLTHLEQVKPPNDV